MKLKFYMLIVLVFSFCRQSFAQLSGAYTIPGSYASIAAAVTNLNSAGLSGPVTINIASGYTETAPAGGYLLGSAVLNASLSSVKTLTIQKSGATANPLITSFTGTTTATDGIFKIAGADYVKIDGIDLQEAAGNTTPATVMEWGYAFVNLNAAAPFDGCNHNTIQNCVITLKNTVAANERGIYTVHSTANSTVILSIAAAADAHSDNKFYHNTITNCVTAIYMAGGTVYDQNNDIGGSAAATGNTITNFIGAFTNNSAVFANNQNNLNVSNNILDVLANGGTALTGASFGINVAGTGSVFTLSSNTITLSTAATVSTSIYGIRCTSAAAAITANNNIISVTEASGLPITDYGIALQNAVNISVTGNKITQTRNTGTVTAIGTTYGIYTGATGTLLVESNTITQTGTSPCRGTTVGIGSYNNGISETINNNIFLNTSVMNSTSGSLLLIQTLTTSPDKTISGNSISGTLVHSLSSGSGSTVCIALTPQDVITGGAAVISNNNFSNITTAFTQFTGLNIITVAPSTETVTINNNTISNVTVTSFAFVIECAADDVSNQNFNITNNTISNITGTGSLLEGIATSSGNTVTVSGNTISQLSTSGAGSIYGIAAEGTQTVTENIFKNKIYNLNSGTNLTKGIIIQGGATVTVSNNIIGNLTGTAVNLAAPSVFGIDITSTQANSNVKLYYNTVYLNAASSGTNFSSAGISHIASATPTTAALDLRNNIIVNNSAHNGSGFTSAVYRTAATLANYSGSSNNNLLYAGTPGPSNLIYYDAVTGYQTLATFSAAAAPREAASVTEDPVFASLTGSSSSFLHFAPYAGGLAESGAANISGFTTDYDNETRAGNAGYSGIGSAPDIGADEGEFAARGNWRGGISSSWNNPANWSAGIIPTAAINVTINAGTTFSPLIDIPNAAAKDLTIGTGASLGFATTTAAINVTGAFTINGTYNAASGKTSFTGGTQNIPALTYLDMEINSPGNKTLSGPVTVNGVLTLTNGFIVLGNNDLRIGNTGNIAGGSNNSFVVVNGPGALVQNNIGSGGRTGPVLFPTGISTASYTPATLDNSAGVADNFSIRVINHLHLQYDASGNGTTPAITDKVVDRTWHISEAIAGGSNASLTLQWNAADELSSFQRSRCFVTHHTGSNFDHIPEGAASGSDPYTSQRTGISSFSPFGVVSELALLPVRLTSFSGIVKSNNVQLSWIAAEETGLAGYILQRSSNGNSYDDIYTTPAHGANINYFFEDKNVLSEKVFYRLKMNDLNGSFRYSNIISFKIVNPGKSNYALGSNPVSGNTVFIKPLQPSDKKINIVLTDLTGKIIVTLLQVPAKATIPVSVKGLPAGMYILKIDEESLKIIKE